MGQQINSAQTEFKPRELEILQLMSDGLSNQEIGSTLFIAKETVRWYLKIIYGKLGTSRRTEAVALARNLQLIEDNQQPITIDLPATTGPFVGRDDEIEALHALLNRPGVRLITIVAAGGMGKSRLSLEFGHTIKRKYKHKAAFIDLTTVQHPDEIARTALVTLGQTFSGQGTPQEQLINYCRGKALLLIFDNFEHLLPETSLIREILTTSPKVTMIVTTRERLNMRAESVFYLQPLDQSGTQLFHELAEMIHPHLKIESAEQPAIERIITLVGGLPLAIILAVAWLDILSPAEVAAEIEASLDILSTEMGDMPERHRSIRALLNPAWERLNGAEQKAFMQAAVFRGGFTRDLFQQATGASMHTVQRLLHRSLIGQGHGRRYHIHPLIRQYAAEKLAADHSEATAKKAHLEAVASYAARQVKRMDQGHYLDALRLLVIEYENFRAALDWSLAGNDVDKGIELAETLHNFWAIRSQMQECATYFEMALAHRPDLAVVHLRLAYAYYRLGQPKQAQHHNDQAMKLAEAAQTFDLLSISKRYSSFIGGRNKPEHEAKAILAEAMRYAQLSGDSRVIANSHVELGMHGLDYNKDYQIALTHFQKALAYYDSRGLVRGISMVIYNMALVYYLQGDTKQARKLCERSLKLKREIGDRAGEARRFSALAAWDIEEEEFERAALALAESRVICEELGERRRLRYVIVQQGMLAMIMGEYGRSESLLQESIQLAYVIDENKFVSHIYLGLLYLLTQRIEQAEPHIYQSMRAPQATDFERWFSFVAYGTLLWHRKDLATCSQIAAVLEWDLAGGERRDRLSIKYFLKPLIYRVQQALGEVAWKQMLEQTADVIFQPFVQEMVERVSISKTAGGD